MYQSYSTSGFRGVPTAMSPPPPSGCVLWLHDLGEEAPREIAEISRRHIPWCAFNCPHADRHPLTLRAAQPKAVPSWFGAAQLPICEGEAREVPADLDEAIKQVHRRIDFLQNSMGLRSGRIIVAGFGQGGALAIAAGLSYRERLAGILCHSGWVIHDTPDLQLMSKGPNASSTIAMLHGKTDETVEFSVGRDSAEALRAAGFSDVVFQSFEDQDHIMSQLSLGRVIDFFRARLPAVDTSSRDEASAELSALAAAPNQVKSKSVIKIGGRRKEELPSSPAQPGASSQVGVHSRKPSERVSASTVSPTAATTATAPPASSPNKQEQLSRHPATAAALAARNKEALQLALAGRSGSLDQREMAAIAELMLDDVNDETTSAVNTSTDALDRKPSPKQMAPCGGLIDEHHVRSLGTTEKASNAVRGNYAYQLQLLEDRLVLLVSVPESIESLSQLELCISSSRVEIHVQGEQVLGLDLPGAIVDSEATAKFRSKRHELRLEAPIS